jgi:8-oxo-dGTP diphosphatase
VEGSSAATSSRPRQLVVGAALVDDLSAPRLLLAARRTEPPELAGGWELPGGKVEPGEDPVEALHRELFEELGVRVRLGGEVEPTESEPAPSGAEPRGWPMSPRLRMRVWLARVTGGEAAPLEDHDAIRWLEPGQWMDVSWLPADVPVIRALLERFPSAGDVTGPLVP